MKIECRCGALIFDSTDNLPDKAHFVPDKSWNRLWENIDAAIEKSGPSPDEKEAACMELRSSKYFRTMWQCGACGRLYIDDEQNELHVFEPESLSTSKRILDKS